MARKGLTDFKNIYHENEGQQRDKKNEIFITKAVKILYMNFKNKYTS